MAEVIQRQVNESYLMGYIKLPTKSRWWKFNGATEILLQAPHPPFLPPSPPPPLFLPVFFPSFFFCLASEEWGLWIVAS